VKQFPKIVIYSFVLTSGALCLLVDKGWNLHEAYGKIQGALFTGFLTIGGFLLTLKTFILVQLREKLFDSADYKAHYARIKELDPTASLYGPLKNLGTFLLYSVVFSIVTSVAHLTVGFIPSQYAAVFCLSLSFCTLSLVLRAWLAIRKSLRIWFDHMKDP